mmetsp:Transcript_126448/g.200530  ORF Transcript_126448/g.200530 Transcript_126448/m.200530 type:complete len:127 (+) Transcript_126448:47-427(+)
MYSSICILFAVCVRGFRRAEDSVEGFQESRTHMAQLKAQAAFYKVGNASVHLSRLDVRSGAADVSPTRKSKVVKCSCDKYGNVVGESIFCGSIHGDFGVCFCKETPSKTYELMGMCPGAKQLPSSE